MRVQFQVRRGDLQTPNSLGARVYNLSQQTAQKISTTEFQQVQRRTATAPITMRRRRRHSRRAARTPARSRSSYSRWPQFAVNSKPGYVPDFTQDKSIRGDVLFGKTNDEMRDWCEQRGSK